MTSSCGGVTGSAGTGYWSQAVDVRLGVVGSPSPVCQMPAPLFWNQSVGSPSALAVWKPQIPMPVYSHMLPAGVAPGLLAGCRTPAHPPLFQSKLQGILSTPRLGPVGLATIPLSSTPL